MPKQRERRKKTEGTPRTRTVAPPILARALALQGGQSGHHGLRSRMTLNPGGGHWDGPFQGKQCEANRKGPVSHSAKCSDVWKTSLWGTFLKVLAYVLLYLDCEACFVHRSLIHSVSGIFCGWMAGVALSLGIGNTFLLYPPLNG